MAQSLKLDVDDARDSLSILIPDAKNGDAIATNYVLKNLGIKTLTAWTDASNDRIWSKAIRDGNEVRLNQMKTSHNIVPDVIGMGARDAVFLMESHGVKTRLRGRGKVKSQSVYAGTATREGMICELSLE